MTHGKLPTQFVISALEIHLMFSAIFLLTHFAPLNKFFETLSQLSMPF